MAVRGLILKNRRAAKDYDDKLADYFIITDVKKGKMCCIASSKLYNFKDNGAVMTSSADPELSDFSDWLQSARRCSGDQGLLQRNLKILICPS